MLHGGGNDYVAMQAALNHYMDTHERIIIEGEGDSYDEYKEKLMTELASKTTPELFKIEPQWAVELRESKYLEELSDHYDILDLNSK